MTDVQGSCCQAGKVEKQRSQQTIDPKRSKIDREDMAYAGIRKSNYKKCTYFSMDENERMSLEKHLT